MSKGNRFTEEFKLEAVKQLVERGFGFGVTDVSSLREGSHSMHFVKITASLHRSCSQPIYNSAYATPRTPKLLWN